MMRILRFVFLCIFVIQLTLINCGCTNKEINKRLFVAAIGIDKDKNNKELFMVTLTAVILEKQSTQYNNYKAEARTIAAAIEMLKAQVSREIDFSYTKVILFGKSMAEEDLTAALDWMMRVNDIETIAYTAICNPDSNSILEKRVQLQNKNQKSLLTNNSLLLALDNTGTSTNYITQVYLFDFYRRMSERGLDPFLPIIRIKEDHFEIDQLALFEKGNKLRIKTILSPEETQIFNMISKDKHNLNLYISSSVRNFVIRIQNVRHNYSINSFDGTEPEINYNIKITGVIAESTNSLNPIDLKTCEELTSEEIKSNIIRLLKKLRAENIDPIGFGLRYRSRNWNNLTKWEDWQGFYPNIDVKVNVIVNLKSTGLIR